MNNNEILANLHNFINSKTSNDKYVSLLKGIKESDISIGKEPQYFFANISCNSTGVGVSSFHGNETQRTVARDYVTDEYLFIDGQKETGAKGLQLFYLKPGETINYFTKDDIVKLAKRYGYSLHLQYFQDLNFRISDHRLNRYTLNIISDPVTLPIKPIWATYSKNGDRMIIGYIYTKNGKEHVLIEPQDIKKDKNEGFFAPWMLISLVFPPLLLVLIFVYIVKQTRERWFG